MLVILQFSTQQTTVDLPLELEKLKEMLFLVKSVFKTIVTVFLLLHNLSTRDALVQAFYLYFSLSNILYGADFFMHHRTETSVVIVVSQNRSFVGNHTTGNTLVFAWSTLISNTAC